jgi:hypothetical protein
MLNKNKTIATLIGLLVGFACVAQNTTTKRYLDTLVLTTDSEKEINFSFDRMSHKENYLTNELWVSILGALSSAVEATEDPKGIQVSYTKGTLKGEEVAKIEVKKLADNGDVYLISAADTKEIRVDRIEVLIHVPKLAVSFYVDDVSELDQLKQLKVEEVWTEVNQKYIDQGKRRRYYGTGTLNFGKVAVQNIEGNPAGLDALELSAGVGLGFYRDRFVPDLGFKVGFNFPNRSGETITSFGLLYTQQYFFTETTNQDFDLDINGFLSAFVRLELENNKGVGFAFGTLIHRDGGFYKGGTYKMSLYTSGGKSALGVSPELIFTNGFKQVIPAFRIGLTF